MSPRSHGIWRGVLLVLALGVLVSGCRPPNLPESVRWWLFSTFGAERICPEMLKKSMTLRLGDRAPGLGRFFPSGCSYNVDDARRVVTVHLQGTGYGYMPPAKRVGFSIQTSVEYRPDFYFVDDDVYVWGKLNQVVQGPNFQLGYVENPVVDLAANIPPFGNIANFLGNQIVQGEMMRGFTVVRNLDTDSDTFALGILNPPAKPYTPYDLSEDDMLTYANETVDVYVNQRDYLGPFEVTEDDQSMLFRATVTGPAAEMMVVDKFTGDNWRESYQTGRDPGPPPGPVYYGAPLEPGAQSFHRIKVPPGLYYIVLDNTSTAGIVKPPVSIMDALMGQSSRISYAAQLED